MADGQNHGEALVRLEKVWGEWGEDFGVGSLIGSVCHTNIFVAYFTESLGKSR